MRISYNQIEAITEKLNTIFEERVVSSLQDCFPSARSIPRKELLQGVRKQVTNARNYHLNTEQQIMTYVTTSWLLGSRFDIEFPAAQAILTSSKYLPGRKSKHLEQLTKEVFSVMKTK